MTAKQPYQRKVDSVCPSPLAMLARTCQNIGQMMKQQQQQQQSKSTLVPAGNNSCDQAHSPNTTRHRSNNSLGNSGSTSINFVPDSNSVCTTGTIINTGSLDYNHGTKARNERLNTTSRLPESKLQGEPNGAELIALHGRRNLPAKARRFRTEQARNPQRSSTTQRSSPSPTLTGSNAISAHNVVHDKHCTTIRLASTTTGQNLSKFSSPAANYPGSLGAYAYSTAEGGTLRNRPESLSPSNEYLSDGGNAAGNSSNALAQLARLSSSLPLPDPPRLSTNQYSGFHNQPDVQAKLAGQHRFDPLRIQTGAKRQRPGGSHRQSTMTQGGHTGVGHSGGFCNAPKPLPRHSNPPSMTSLSSPSASCGIPLLFPGSSTSPTCHSSAPSHAFSFNQLTSRTSNGSTTSSSSVSPPVSTVHSQWFSLINSLQHMASVQHQKDDQSQAPTGHQADVLSYQLAFNFLEYFYGKMKNGSPDFHSLLSNQFPGTCGSLPMAMELAKAAVAAAAAANRQDREFRSNGVGNEKSSPSQYQSSSSSSPTSLGNNSLATALPTHSQSYDLFCQRKSQTSLVDGYKCSVCGHVCCDLQEFYSHFYVHLMANSYMPQQPGKVSSPTCATPQEAINSASNAYRLSSGIGSSCDFPMPSADQMTGPLTARDQLVKTLFNDRPTAMGADSMWSGESMMRWLSNYRNFVTPPTESKLFRNHSHGSQHIAPSTSMPCPERDSIPRFENGGFNFLQAFESNDPRFMWMRLLAEHAMPNLLSPTTNNGNVPTNAPMPMSNPMLSPLNMPNAHLTLFPQV